MDSIMNYLTQFFSLESIAIMVITLISFLFGLLIGYLRWGSKLSKLKKEVREKDQLIATLEGEVSRLKEELALKDADLQKATFELEEWDKNMKRLEDEKSLIKSELYASKDVVKELKASNQTYRSTVEDLNLQVSKLQSENEGLHIAVDTVEAPSNNLAELQSTYNATNTRLAAFEEKLAQLESENASLKATINTLHTGETSPEVGNSDRLTQIESRLDELATENERLKTELNQVQNNAIQYIDDDLDEGEDAHEVYMIGAANASTGTTNIIAKPVSTDKEIYGDKLNVEEAIKKDDLTKIDGIGPFIEKKLNEINIYTYEQIAAFDKAKIEEVTRAIQFLPGRIDKDNWVGQASNLSYAGEEDALEAYAVDGIPVPPVDVANLQVVEGIGPKIEEKLKAGGINDLNELADAKIETLKGILDKAGSHYRIHDPSTWPDQAKLAAAGDWGKLKTYQDYLVGGREPE